MHFLSGQRTSSRGPEPLLKIYADISFLVSLYRPDSISGNWPSPFIKLKLRNNSCLQTLFFLLLLCCDFPNDTKRSQHQPKHDEKDRNDLQMIGQRRLKSRRKRRIKDRRWLHIYSLKWNNPFWRIRQAFPILTICGEKQPKTAKK